MNGYRRKKKKEERRKEERNERRGLGGCVKCKMREYNFKEWVLFQEKGYGA